MRPPWQPPQPACHRKLCHTWRCIWRVTRDVVYIADEAFFTGGAAEVTPIIEIDRRRSASGRPGPLTKRLHERFFACVHGEDARHAEWLTPVL